MWGHDIQPRRALIVIDPSGKLNIEGIQFDNALASYKEVKIGSLGIDAYRLTFLSRELTNKIIEHSPHYLVLIALDWMRTDEWVDQFKQLSNLRLLITTVNCRAALKSRPAADLSVDFDTCTQFLRTQAMKNSATLAYSDEELDLKPFIGSLLDIHTHQFEQRSLGLPILINNDSKDNILALNPQFDYKSAFNLEIELPQLASRRTKASTGEHTHEAPPETLKQMLANAVSDAEKAQKNTTRQQPVYTPVLTDDKQVISEFFTKITQKYN